MNYDSMVENTFLGTLLTFFAMVVEKYSSVHALCVFII